MATVLLYPVDSRLRVREPALQGAVGNLDVRSGLQVGPCGTRPIVRPGHGPVADDLGVAALPESFLGQVVLGAQEVPQGFFVVAELDVHLLGCLRISVPLQRTGEIELLPRDLLQGQ